ncbi:MAG: preprotein translocase subunit SecE [Deltaproteobacteria bacterium]|nr:preprotein translocase subunit SecE [Deltaproteobacteria bacterium]
MNNRQIAVAAFLAFSALVWYVVERLVTQFAVSLGVARRVPGGEAFFVVVPLAVAGGLALYLIRNQRANDFMNEVITELKKVSWPVRKEIVASTVVAVVIMLLAGAILGLFDAFWAHVFKLIL